MGERPPEPSPNADPPWGQHWADWYLSALINALGFDKAQAYVLGPEPGVSDAPVDRE